ncbi:MAG: lysophospholipase [Saccharofermentans sp.]|nr:lysophospholipase [Saccharofermentans sp.]
MQAVLLIAAIVVFIALSGFIFMWIYVWGIAKKQYSEMFIRTSPDKWARGNSCPENEEHSVMFNAGMKWGEENASYKEDVEITSKDGLKLKGEYFNFGYDRAALILAGRAETVLYCYYFAELFQKAGCNVIVVDPRACGLSEGKYTTAGMKEGEDAGLWIDYIHERYGIEKFFIHGICVGSAQAIYVAAAHQAYLKGIILEGPYSAFYKVLLMRTKNHGKPTFPVCLQMAMLYKKLARVNVFKNKPIEEIKKVEVPALFLCGREDKSNSPDDFELIYNACGSAKKKFVWFDHGAHSHLRIVNLEKYDSEVIDFING